MEHFYNLFYFYLPFSFRASPTDGTARIFHGDEFFTQSLYLFSTLCRKWDSNSHLFEVGRSTDWATAAAASFLFNGWDQRSTS